MSCEPQRPLIEHVQSVWAGLKTLAAITRFDAFAVFVR
ncbi:hypothetical protein CSB96_4647 [Pseudomonas aeruginosa]|nr:hypothetical protein CSB96_4647 [Pseudomonas aeruginosa]